MKDGKREEPKTIDLKITKHYGKPEFPSYVQVGRLNFLSAAELYFSSEPEGKLVYRICNWLASFIVERVAELQCNFEEEEIGMILQSVKKEPPIMGAGYLQGVLKATFNEEAADTLDILRLCEAADDRVYDCFMAQFWSHVKENDQLKFFLEESEERKGVTEISGKDDSDM